LREYLLRTSLGLKVATIIEGSFLLAPELLDVEVLSVLRRAVLRRQLNEQRALRAIEDLLDWPIDRIPHRSLDWAAWQHRNNVSAYGAFYVAAARLSEASLITADGPLARAPSLGIVVENVR
jgi:predicted nucleic acid-binding protein